MSAGSDGAEESAEAGAVVSNTETGKKSQDRPFSPWPRLGFLLKLERSSQTALKLL